MKKTKYDVRQRVWFTVAETSPLGGGRHKGVVDSVTTDIFDGSTLYLVKAKGGAVVPVREEAMTERPIIKKQHEQDVDR